MTKESHSLSPAAVQASPPAGLNARSLARAIFQAEVPEKFIRTLPAQSLFMVVRHNGLLSSSDLIQIAGLEQCRLMIDFDVWHNGRFDEDALFEWLGLEDDDPSHGLLRKILNFVDLKLIGILISKHVDVVTFEEPTENPPEANYYTPDKGYTWIHVKLEDSHRHFVLSRFLAMMFESSAEVFYQLLSIPLTTTTSILEEEAYQERQKRLSSQGVPDAELAYEIFSPITEHAALHEIGPNESNAVSQDVPAIAPLIYHSNLLQPLAALVDSSEKRGELEAELSLLMNAAIVRAGIDFHYVDDVTLLADKVKGAINIGLEVLQAASKLEPYDIYQRLGLNKILAVGLEKLFRIRNQAISARRKLEDEAALPPRTLALIEAASAFIPGVPRFYDMDMEGDLDHTTSLPGGTRAIESLAELNMLLADLETI